MDKPGACRHMTAWRSRASRRYQCGEPLATAAHCQVASDAVKLTAWLALRCVPSVLRTGRVQSFLSCRQADALNESMAASVHTAQSAFKRKQRLDAQRVEEQEEARFRLDLADGMLTGILLMMIAATYYALATGFVHLQLGRSGMHVQSHYWIKA